MHNSTTLPVERMAHHKPDNWKENHIQSIQKDTHRSLAEATPASKSVPQAQTP